MDKIVTGFHAIEERVTRALDEQSGAGLRIVYSKPGPRVKKILALAKDAGISCAASDDEQLDALVQPLPETARDHRGIVLCVSDGEKEPQNSVQFDAWIAAHAG